MTDTQDLVERALAFVKRKYVARLHRDILYVEAGQDDLARETANFCAQELSGLQARVAELEGALTPSAETKAAYIGEFSVPYPVLDDEGNDVIHKVNVPWVVIKEIMAAIRARADLARKDTP